MAHHDIQFLLMLFIIAAPSLAQISTKTRTVVNPHPFTFSINNPNICSSNTDILIWIHTAPNHYNQRNVLRQTWANPANYHRHNVSVVFFLGSVTNPSLQTSIEYESEIYRDMIQATYKDSYRNLTYKAISGCKWVSTYCQSAKTIIKTDDDMIVDIFLLFKHLDSLQSRNQVINNTFLCAVWKNRKPDRNPGKWHVNVTEYKESVYPTYCPGLGLVMTADLVPRLYHASLYEPYFWIDDVYFTGLLGRTLNATYETIAAAVHFGDSRKIKVDTTFTNPFQWIFYHLHDKSMMYSLWNKIVSFHRMRGSDLSYL